MNSAHRVSRSSILVTGCGRSGTSLISRIFATAAGTCLSFDSPFLHTFFSRITHYSDVDSQLLYSKFLVSSHIVDFFSGRSININPNTLTFSGNLIEPDLLHSVSYSTNTRNQIIDSNVVPIVKVTDLVNLPLVCDILKLTQRPVIILRDLNDVVSSMYHKQWFSDANISSLNCDYTLPLVLKESFNVLAPYWLDDSDISAWASMTCLDRTMFYVFHVTRYILDTLNSKSINPIIISYARLVESPLIFTTDLFRLLRLTPTSKTYELLKSISVHSQTSPRLNISDLSESPYFNYVAGLNQRILDL